MKVSLDLEEFFEDIDKVEEEAKSLKEKLVDLSQNTAERMQDNFSNLFFDAITGELKTLEDYADAVFKSMARMLADFAAKAAVEGLFGEAGGGTGGGLFGAIAGGLAGIIGAGGGGGGAGATSGMMSMIDKTGYAYGFSRGAAFAGPPAAKHVVRMATGGVVSSPTYFPLADGAALMGEAGPEGVLPLKRTSSGKLGVEVAGDGGGRTIKNKYNVNINVAAPEGRLASESMSQLHSTLYNVMRRDAERNN
jgi:phage-related minor tail protein